MVIKGLGFRCSNKAAFEQMTQDYLNKNIGMLLRAFCLVGRCTHVQIREEHRSQSKFNKEDSALG